MSIIIAFCFAGIINDIQYKSINIKGVSSLIIIISSIYFGILFERRKKAERTGEEADKTIIPNQHNIPEEFKEEEDRFLKLES